MPTRVVVAGGGVAAMETVAALRALAGSAPAITVIAPATQIEQRPMSVTVPFGARRPPPDSLQDVARHAPFELHRGTLRRVDPQRHVAELAGGETVAYDTLVIAVGAVPEQPFPGAITFAGAQDATAVTDAVQSGGRIVFVAPIASAWTLPIYELAALAAQAQPDADIAVVTAERSPLWIFGEQAGEAIRELFERRNIGLLSDVSAVAVAGGELELADAEPIAADHAIALPRLAGPAIAGLPHDDAGFLVVDDHGAVAGTNDVFAAGDATAFPVKQGGLAAQQADAVARAIAARLGAAVEPAPFEPILRGLLLTGGAPLYVRSDGAHGTSHRVAHATVSADALWWPPAKVASRYLSALLRAGASEGELHDLERQGDEQDAAELALMVAREDAEHGDYDGALRALDAAERLGAAELDEEWQRTRTLWRGRAKWLP